MMGMGSDKRKIGAMILALAPKKNAEPAKDEYAEMVKMTASKVIEAIKSGDAEMLIKELPKLLNNLPQPEVEFEDD
jgi:hypothetical protein